MEIPKKETFDEKYDKYSTLIYRTAYQYLLSVESAEDVTQEAFVKLFTNRKKFNDDEHEKAWLLRVTINLCKNMLRSKSVGNVILSDEIEAVAQPFEGNSDLRLDMRKIIQTLSPEQRAVIYLHYFEGFKVSEIARLTKSKEGTVKSQLSRARQSLKSTIEKE